MPFGQEPVLGHICLILHGEGLRPGKKHPEGTLAELGRRAASRDAPGRQYHAGGSGQAGSAPKRRVQFHAPWGGYRACGGQSALIWPLHPVMG
jgi:hypothetical protein